MEEINGLSYTDKLGIFFYDGLVKNMKDKQLREEFDTFKREVEQMFNDIGFDYFPNYHSKIVICDKCKCLIWKKDATMKKLVEKDLYDNDVCITKYFCKKCFIKKIEK